MSRIGGMPNATSNSDSKERSSRADDRRKRQENWLLIKADDEVARSARDPDILEEKPHPS